MMADPSTGLRGTGAWIRPALAFKDGYLFIGEGGSVLCFRQGAQLEGYDVETTKAACITAGPAVIDIRGLDVGTALRIARDEPRPAPGERPDARPFYGWTYRPLRTVAALHHAADAEVVNVPDVTGARTGAVA